MQEKAERREFYKEHTDYTLTIYGDVKERIS